VNSIYGPVTMRGADHQLLIPNYMVTVKTADGKLRPVIDGTFPVSGIPAASPLCKM
jgi:branched-chain amino acid transport system substrate-binding protein